MAKQLQLSFCILIAGIRTELLAHVDNTTNAVSSLHIGEGLVHLVERLTVGDEFVNLEVAVQVVINETRQLGAALDTTERTAFPYTACDKLEGAGGNLLACRGDTDDDGFSPALVAGFERGTHDVYIACAVKGVVTAAVGHLDELLLYALITELGGVDEVGGAEFLSPLLLAVVDVDGYDHAGLVFGCALDDGQTDAACAEDGNVGTLLNTTLSGGDDGGPITGRDTAAKQAGAIHGCFFSDGDDGDVGDDGVLREGRCAHEVEEVLAPAFEARGAIGHETFTLGSPDLAAEIGLSRLAELALLAFGCAEQCELVLDGG